MGYPSDGKGKGKRDRGKRAGKGKGDQDRNKAARKDKPDFGKIPAARRDQFEAQIQELKDSSDTVRVFEASLTSLERLFVHTSAQEAGLLSRSSGQGKKRHIKVMKDPGTEPFNVVVTQLSGNDLKFTVGVGDTIDALKAQISKSIGLEPAAQQLFLDGKVFKKGEKKLVEKGVHEGSILTLVTVSTTRVLAFRSWDTGSQAESEMKEKKQVRLLASYMLAKDSLFPVMTGKAKGGGKTFLGTNYELELYYTIIAEGNTLWEIWNCDDEDSNWERRVLVTTVQLGEPRVPRISWDPDEYKWIGRHSEPDWVSEVLNFDGHASVPSWDSQMWNDYEDEEFDYETWCETYKVKRLSEESELDALEDAWGR